jgi:hypothetical protein
MTPDDELERELASFRPRPPSPELRRRVRGRLSRRRLLAFAAAAAIAAAVIVAVLVNRPPTPGDGVVIVPPATAGAAPEPSLLAYRRAAAKSSDAFENLLDREAVRSSESGPVVRTASGFLTFRGPNQ